MCGNCHKSYYPVLPAQTPSDLIHHSPSFYIFQLGKVTETLTGQLESKGKEINEYREKYNLRIRGEEDTPSEINKEKESKASSGVLVAKDT